MNNTTIKNVLLGIALSLVAAYIFPILLLNLLGFVPPLTVIPLYALFYTIWLVLPLGASLGMLIPQIAKGKTLWMAALHGAGFGAVAGLASVFCLIYVFNLHREKELGLLWVSGILYCALWTGGYAFYRAKGRSLSR